MGDVIVLTERIADRSRAPVGARPAFFFDVACPLCYLAAEQVERLFSTIDWIPTAAAGICDEGERAHSVDQHERAERRAAELRLPLVWPERFPAPVPSALRASAHAADEGAGDRFALAASRLAFCGGFDLEDPEILAEAGAAAGIALNETLHAAGDRGRDVQLYATARGLRRRGLSTLPVIRVGTHWFEGEYAAAAAAELQRLQALYGTSLAPSG
jgi:2-hydroxychromene-2-carboxylate isomerase